MNALTQNPKNLIYQNIINSPNHPVHYMNMKIIHQHNFPFDSLNPLM